MKKPERPSGRIIYENKPMNPKLFWSIVIIGIILISIMVLSCEHKVEPYEVEKVESENARFKTLYGQSDQKYAGELWIRVIHDNETEIDYLFVMSGFGGGLCKLEQPMETLLYAIPKREIRCIAINPKSDLENFEEIK